MNKARAIRSFIVVAIVGLILCSIYYWPLNEMTQEPLRILGFSIILGLTILIGTPLAYFIDKKVDQLRDKPA